MGVYFQIFLVKESTPQGFAHFVAAALPKAPMHALKHVDGIFLVVVADSLWG
jgi:hypothetical protein